MAFPRFTSVFNEDLADFMHSYCVAVDFVVLNFEFTGKNFTCVFFNFFLVERGRIVRYTKPNVIVQSINKDNIL